MDQLEADIRAGEQTDAKCFIEINGKVNCSTIIYEDEKSWKKSRNQVDLLIQALKHKIIELKDIRRHLKENKPKNMTDYESDSNENASLLTSSEEYDQQREALGVEKILKPIKRLNSTVTTKTPLLKSQKSSISMPTSDEANNNDISSPPTTALYSVAPNIKTVLVNKSSTSSPPTTRPHNRKSHPDHNKNDEHHRRHHQSQRTNENRTKNSTRIQKIGTTTIAPSSTKPTKSTIEPKFTSSMGMEITESILNSLDVLNRFSNVSSLLPILSTRSGNHNEEFDMTTEYQHYSHEKPTVATNEQSRTECFCEPDTQEEFV